jgi:hypothetical protein
MREITEIARKYAANCDRSKMCFAMVGRPRSCFATVPNLARPTFRRLVNTRLMAVVRIMPRDRLGNQMIQ